jgi:glycosyltransferase involved in cell wall biosynthesis
MMVSRKIFIEPLWKLHSLHRSMIDFPPASYRFFSAASITEKTSEAASKSPFFYRLQHLIEKGIPLNLALAYVKSIRRPPPADLIYSYSHLVFRNVPWILDMEYANLLVSPYPEHFYRYRKTVRKSLESPNCRKILCETRAGMKSVMDNLNCTGLEQKLDILPVAGKARSFIKAFKEDKIRFLFVGSTNILGEFDIKGGREALECFHILQQRYNNLELVVRSDIPHDIKKKYLDIPGIRLIEKRISWASLEREFHEADIFLLPAHNTPFLAFLDAMSYELPVLTIDAWANPEFVEEGTTGLLAGHSKIIPYVIDSYLPTFGTPRFTRAIKTPDPVVVESLVRQASILIEDPALRRRLGKAGRWEVENGKFSMQKRNEKLKRIFDEAIENTPWTDMHHPVRVSL